MLKLELVCQLCVCVVSGGPLFIWFFKCRNLSREPSAEMPVWKSVLNLQGTGWSTAFHWNNTLYLLCVGRKSVSWLHQIFSYGMTHRELNPQPWNYLCIALSIQAKDTEPVNRTRQQHKKWFKSTNCFIYEVEKLIKSPTSLCKMANEH